MKIQFCIKEIAKERGITLSKIAKELRMPLSNMSAIASGRRGVSLRVLNKVSTILDCDIEELFLIKEDRPVFKNKNTQALLKATEGENYDGIDKTWVNRVMLAQKAHYGLLYRGI